MLRPGRKVSVTVAVLAITAGLLYGQTAKADPHAVFYTAVGQQQLFFNMLAALDQADYVEPADGDNSRDLLIQARDTAGFGPETDERLNATKTDLASILTRSVTLEGNDVWSSYLALQFALEASRRNNTDELIRILCERGFGRKACRTDMGEDLEEAASTAFVVDPAEREAIAFKAALEGSLSAGTSVHENMVRGIVSGDESYVALEGNPVPYSESLAKLRENSQGDSDKILGIERGVGEALNMYRNSGVDSTVFDGIEFSETGDAKLADSEPKSTGNLIGKVLGMMSFSVSVQEEAAQSAAVARTHLAQTESQGAVADTRSEPVIESGRAKGAEAKMDVPAWAKVAAGQAAIDSISQLTSNSAFAPAVADYKPGEETLVGSDESASGGPVQCGDVPDPDYNDGCSENNVRGDKSCTTSGGVAGQCVLDYEMRRCYLGNTPTRTEVAHYYCQATGSVNGITTAEQGQVAGLVDWLGWLWDLYSQPKEPELDSSTNPIGFQHESAAHDLYEALGLTDENGNDGNILNNVLGASSSSLMDHINEL